MPSPATAKFNWNRGFRWSYAVLLIVFFFPAFFQSVWQSGRDMAPLEVHWGFFFKLYGVMAFLPVVGLVLTYFFGEVNRKLGVRLYLGLWVVWAAVILFIAYFFPGSYWGHEFWGWDLPVGSVAIPAIPLAVMASVSWLAGKAWR